MQLGPACFCQDAPLEVPKSPKPLPLASEQIPRRKRPPAKGKVVMGFDRWLLNASRRGDIILGPHFIWSTVGLDTLCFLFGLAMFPCPRKPYLNHKEAFQWETFPKYFVTGSESVKQADANSMCNVGILNITFLNAPWR